MGDLIPLRDILPGVLEKIAGPRYPARRKPICRACLLGTSEEGCENQTFAKDDYCPFWRPQTPESRKWRLETDVYERFIQALNKAAERFGWDREGWWQAHDLWLYHLTDLPESPIEQIFAIEILERHGTWPLCWQMQREEGPYRIDFAYVSGMFKVAVELDGRGYHSSRDQVQHDRLKDEYLQANGWYVVRIPGSAVRFFARYTINAIENAGRGVRLG